MDLINRIRVTTEVTVESTFDPEGHTRLLALEAQFGSTDDGGEPIDPKTFGGGPLGTYWGQGRIGYSVFINGVDVTAPAADDFKSSSPPSSSPPSLPQSARCSGTFDRAKEQLLDSAVSLNTSYEKFKAKRIPKRAPPPPPLNLKHDPRIEYHTQRVYSGGLDLAVPMISPRSEFSSHQEWEPGCSLRDIRDNVARKISHTFTRERDAKDMTALPFQRPAVPDMEANLTSRQVAEINEWAANAISEGRGTPIQDPFLSLTTRELLRLGGSRIDTIEIAKHYSDPPNTPLFPPTKQFLEVGELKLDDDADLDAEFDKAAKANRKDLLNYLGHARHQSLHLVAGRISSYDHALNLSDSYGMPIVEPRDGKKVIVGGELESPQVKCSTSSDDTDNTAVERADDVESGILEEDDSTISDVNTNIVVEAPTYPPGQALILFLTGKGISPDDITELLYQLDEAFLYSKSKVWAGVLFPEQLDWTDGWVTKVKNLCRPKKQHRWEGLVRKAWEGRVHGKAYKLAKKTLQMGKIKEFIQRTVENHIHWRLVMRERLHPQLY